MSKKKRKLRTGRVIRCLVLLIALFGTSYLCFSLLKNMFVKEELNISFLASSTTTIELYDLDLVKKETVIRGTEVKSYDKKINKENNEYKKIVYDNNKYLVLASNLSENKTDVVKETSMYVRTTLTVYKDFDGSILGTLKKGSKVDITGYDKIDKDGIVNMYKIAYQETEGYVYSKYLVDNEAGSLLNYDESGTYQKHLNRKDTMGLGGGDAGTLDYYPYEKPKFEDNTIPDEARTLYLIGYGQTLTNIDKYIELAKNSNINAFVVDIKDGYMAYESEVAKKYSMSNYKSASCYFDTYKKAIKKLKDAGFYVIGRINVFKDSLYAKDNVDQAIANMDGTLATHNGAYWPSVFQRGVWEFNVGIAKEAVKEFGFNEIQFDYARFPDNIYGREKRGEINLRNDYKESKAEALQQFLFYACDEIHKMGAYVSVDVFGESAYTYVTGYGQYWPAMSNIVDAISAMPYPDHFNSHEFGITEIVWTVPYKVISAWAERAATRQKEIPTPAIVRTWVQAYNAIRSPYNEYGPDQVADQIKALYDNGLTGGFITWNAVSSLTKYTYIAPAFTKKYR